MSVQSPYEITLVRADQAVELRHLVLRPHQSLAQCRYEGDEELTTFHLAIIDDARQIVAVASVMQRQEIRFGAFQAKRQAQLRGMAVRPSHQGQGLGSAIVRTCLKMAYDNDCEMFWCNARQAAVEFYQKFDFRVLNEKPFEIETIGPHQVMYRQR